MNKFAAALVAAFALASTAAYAQTSGSQTSPITRETTTPQGGAPGQAGTILSQDDVRKKLQAEGFSNITDLKREGNKYTATANKGGSKVAVSVDARSGKIDSNVQR